MTSDFHGEARAFRECASKAEELRVEAVVACGDLTHFNTVQRAKDLLAPLLELRLPLFFVPGNCDPPALTGVNIEGAHCIHGTFEVYEDAVFMGAGGGLLSPFHTPFEMTDEELMETLDRSFEHAPNKRWLILVSHHPPSKTKLDVTSGGKHIGSLSVRRFIEEKKPAVVFCGHVHEARGVDRIGETLLVNPGPARHGYCALADFNESIKVKMDRLW